MRIEFPSYKAVFISGAVIMPMFLAFIRYVDSNFQDVFYIDISLILLSIIGFVIPFIVSTFDFAYFKNRYGSVRRMFSIDFDREYIINFSIPAFKRVLVWFISAGISSLILTQLGL